MIKWGQIPGLFAIGLVISVGCGGRVEGEGGASAGGVGHSGGNSGTGTTSGGTSAAGTASVSSACQVCMQRLCSSSFSECSKDAGCIAILACVQGARCQLFDCYSDATCRKVIDQHGGPSGDSMNRLIVASTCSLSVGCPCG